MKPEEFQEAKGKIKKYFNVFKGRCGVYLLEYEYGCKFGRSDNLGNRINSYLKPWADLPKRYEVWCLPKPCDRSDSGKLESKVLNSVPENLKIGEFIHGLSFSEIRSLVKETINNTNRKNSTNNLKNWADNLKKWLEQNQSEILSKKDHTFFTFIWWFNHLQGCPIAKDWEPTKENVHAIVKIIFSVGICEEDANWAGQMMALALQGELPPIEEIINCIKQTDKFKENNEHTQ